MTSYTETDNEISTHTELEKFKQKRQSAVNGPLSSFDNAHPSSHHNESKKILPSMTPIFQNQSQNNSKLVSPKVTSVQQFKSKSLNPNNFKRNQIDQSSYVSGQNTKRDALFTEPTEELT